MNRNDLISLQKPAIAQTVVVSARITREMAVQMHARIAELGMTSKAEYLAVLIYEDLNKPKNKKRNG
jgi:hypothetical protein